MTKKGKMRLSDDENDHDNDHDEDDDDDHVIIQIDDHDIMTRVMMKTMIMWSSRLTDEEVDEMIKEVDRYIQFSANTILFSFFAKEICLNALESIPKAHNFITLHYNFITPQQSYPGVTSSILRDKDGKLNYAEFVRIFSSE